MRGAGAYTADRAAALSGVPKSTIHYWARKGYLVPSVSAERVKLWSYTDLLALRTIYWLRQPKRTHEGQEIPASTMPAVRRALQALQALDLGVQIAALYPSVALSGIEEALDLEHQLAHNLGKAA
jgi:DNA-binding transcriptional MerR regulator